MGPDQPSPTLTGVPHPSVSRQSPNLGEKRESGTAGSMFSVTYISEQLQSFIAWNRILSTRNSFRYSYVHWHQIVSIYPIQADSSESRKNLPFLRG